MDGFTGFTLEQWVVIGLVLLVGIFAGGMLSSGSKWKTRYREEHERYLALERGQDARIGAANERIAELERHDGPIGAGTGAAIAGATRRSDDLSRIRGIGGDTEVRLNEMGFHRYRQIAKLSEEEQARIEGQLGAEPGMIERDRWRDQAEMLAAGRDDEHRRGYAEDARGDDGYVTSDEAQPERRRGGLWGRDKARR